VAVALMSGVAGAGAVLVWTQVVLPQRAEHVARVTGSAADRYAALLDARLAELVAHVNAAAEADASISAVRSEDPAQTAQESVRLASVLPFAERVEIFRSGRADVDLEAAVPITFAALRVTRAAEANGFAGPEGLRVDADSSRLFVARALEADGARLGVLLVALSAEYLLQPLRSLPAPAGRITLMQTFDGLPPLPLLEWGAAGALSQPALALRRPLAVPQWSLVYEPHPVPVTFGGGWFAALAAGLGLTLGLGLVAMRRYASEAAVGAIASDAPPLELKLDSGIEPEIFRDYDIRGIADGNLNPEVVYAIARAFAAEALDRGQPRIVIGRDGRHSSPSLRDAAVRGLTEGGLEVLDAGRIPTPLLYYAAQTLTNATGIMITGSHNPPAYNGLKMLIGGETLAGAAIQALRARIEAGRLSEGRGAVQRVDVTERYLAEIADDVVLARPLKVVVDCGNGVAGTLAPGLFARLGCDTIPLYCDVDGDFPNHHPDPAEPANLEDMIRVVRSEGADLGIAFDGDGDRIGVVSNSGRIIWPDRLLMLFAQDVVSRNPGAAIIYDVKCSRHLHTVISAAGGRPILWKTGHSHLKAKLKETQALLAGEFSGHICFAERWNGFDDALYAAARLLEIIGGSDDTVDTVFDRFPDGVSTPEIKLATSDRDKFSIIERLIRDGDFGDGTSTTIDGLRVDYADGWGLVRASNTSPVLTLRFEADDQAALERVQVRFQDQLSAIDNQLRFR
jgi:phosphomannomutase